VRKKKDVSFMDCHWGQLCLRTGQRALVMHVGSMEVLIMEVKAKFNVLQIPPRKAEGKGLPLRQIGKSLV